MTAADSLLLQLLPCLLQQQNVQYDYQDEGQTHVEEQQERQQQSEKR